MCVDSDEVLSYLTSEYEMSEELAKQLMEEYEEDITRIAVMSSSTFLIADMLYKKARESGVYEERSDKVLKEEDFGS